MPTLQCPFPKKVYLGEQIPVVWKGGQPQPPMLQTLGPSVESHPNFSPEQVRFQIFSIKQDIDSKKKEISLLESFRTTLPSVEIVEKYFGDFYIEIKAVSVEGPNAGTHVIIHPDWLKDKSAFIKKEWCNYVNGKIDNFFFDRISFDNVLKSKNDELAQKEKFLNDILFQYPTSVTTVTPENAKSDIDFLNNILKNSTSAYTGKKPTPQQEERFKKNMKDYLDYLFVVSNLQSSTLPTPAPSVSPSKKTNWLIPAGIVGAMVLLGGKK